MMAFTNIDAQTIEETFDEIGYDVLDSILEDGTFSDREFENTMDMFDDAIMQNQLGVKDLDSSTNPDLGVEASLEPIILEDDIKNAFDSFINVEHSFDTMQESMNMKSDNESKQRSYLNSFKPYSQSTNIGSIVYNHYSQVEAFNERSSDHKSLKPLDSDEEINSLLNPTNAFQSTLEIGTNNPTPSKPKSVKESKRLTLPLSDSSKYRDLSMIADDEAVANINYENLRGRTKELFPVKLHKVIEYSERYGFSSIISWMPHGRAFKIHKENVFIEKVMPHFFYQSKMSSFTRQLRMYGFHRIKGKNNVDKGAYFHELFLRGRPGLTHGIIRLDKPCSLHKSDEPSFYLYRPMPSSPENDHQKSQSDTPTCIRYSDSLSREKPASVNTKLKNSLSAEDKKNGSNATIHKSSLIANNAAIPSLQNSLHFGPRPQAINSYIRQGVQVIYVFHGGHITNNRPVPLHFVSPDVLYK